MTDRAEPSEPPEGLREAAITTVCDILWAHGVYMKDSTPIARDIVNVLVGRSSDARAGDGLLREAAEQAFHWFTMTAGEYHAHYGHNDEPIDALRAALATDPDAGAEVYVRLAASTLTPEERAARQGPGFTEWATIEATGRKPEGARE